jgi:hypothetical protein
MLSRHLERRVPAAEETLEAVVSGEGRVGRRPAPRRTSSPAALVELSPVRHSHAGRSTSAAADGACRGSAQRRTRARLGAARGWPGRAWVRQAPCCTRVPGRARPGPAAAGCPCPALSAGCLRSDDCASSGGRIQRDVPAPRPLPRQPPPQAALEPLEGAERPGSGPSTEGLCTGAQPPACRPAPKVEQIETPRNTSRKPPFVLSAPPGALAACWGSGTRAARPSVLGPQPPPAPTGLPNAPPERLGGELMSPCLCRALYLSNTEIQRSS